MQYYEKNTNTRFCLIAILLLVCEYNGMAQIAGFSFQRQNNCAPARVVFYNESSQGPGITYEWNFGKGGISYSSARILEEVYSEPGSYNVVLKVIQGPDTAVATAMVTIFRGPAAGFTVDQSEGCVPFHVGFNNTSEAGDSPLSTYHWDFRDGTVAETENPDHQYKQSGTFDVFLEITDNNGCTDYSEAKGLVLVHPKPEIRFTASDSAACNTPLIVNFSNHSVADVNLSYHWDFGNGTTYDGYNASAQYTAAGTYDVTLRCDNEMSCNSALTKKAYISVGHASGHIYAIQGGDTITAENALLCPGEIRFGTTVETRTDFYWQIQYNQRKIFVYGKEFIFQLTDSGRFDMKLIFGQRSACPDSAFASFRVDHIEADIEMNPGYSCQLPESVRLTALMENAVAQQWLLPDMSTSNAANISYTVTHDLSYYEIYSHEINRLSYPFMLVATSANGCRDTARKNFNVSLPVARFMPDKVSGCVPLRVSFQDVSRSAEPILKWDYSINDMTYSQPDGEVFVHTFTEPGEYEVMLAVENEAGCTDTSYPVYIKAGDKVSPDFTVLPGEVCYRESIQLVDNTTLQDSIDFWHFSSPRLFNITVSDNSPVTIEVLPATAGHKAVQLEVGYNGCISDTLIQQAFYVNSPAGSFHESFSCDSPLVYTFVSGVSMASSVAWRINDSIVSSLDSFRYQFPSSGEYGVTLEAFNSTSSCLETTTKTVKVRDVKADFIAETVVCHGDSVLLNALISRDYITECYNEGFLWKFQDGRPDKRTFSERYGHVFADTGRFKTNLIVRADNGCEDTIVKEIRVIRPDASFVADNTEGCASGLTVQFTRTGTDEFPVSWTWLFGDNSFDQSSVASVQHYYTSGTSWSYMAGLEVRDSYGCINTSYIPITLYKPGIAFNADDNFVCTGDRVNFNASYNQFDSYRWDFGDGSAPDTLRNHVYTTPGVYDVTLSVIKGGCPNSLQKTHYIKVEEADAEYSVSDSVFDCYPAPVLFTHNAGSPVAEGAWTFASGMQSFGYAGNYQYTYARPGIYNTSLWVRTPNNCQATYSKNITVTGPYATFDFIPQSICYDDPVAFTLTSSQDVSEMEWIFGDGETSTAASPVHNYKAKGIIYPAIWIRNNTCEVTLTSGSLNVSDVTAFFDIVDNKTTFCQYDSLVTHNHSSGHRYITWNIDDTLVMRDSVHMALWLSNPGTMTVQMTADDGKGCTESMIQSITIIPSPSFTIGGDTSICKGVSSSLQVIPANTDWGVKWQPPEGLSDPDSFSPAVFPDSTRTYTATVTDANGCSGTRYIQISVMQPPEINRNPLEDTSIFIGEHIELTVQSNNQGAAYSWSPDYHISCRSCNQPTVSPEKDIVYTVTIKDECFSVTEEFPIEVIIDFYIEAPDAFSPNDDGVNDIFSIKTRNIREIKEFKIFNRWGNLVFETTRLDEGWDGTTNGKAQNVDTYVYYIRVITEHGYETAKKGNFVLIK